MNNSVRSTYEEFVTGGSPGRTRDSGWLHVRDGAFQLPTSITHSKTRRPNNLRQLNSLHHITSHRIASHLISHCSTDFEALLAGPSILTLSVQLFCNAIISVGPVALHGWLGSTRAAEEPRRQSQHACIITYPFAIIARGAPASVTALY